MNRDPAVGGSDEIPLSAGPPTAPRIWVLMGHRAGDNSQLSALADGLGWPYEVKRFVHRRLEVVTNVLFDATLLGSIASRSSPLGPPWPDLVLSAGRRSEPIARWIRRHADHPVKLVHVGRPWRDVRAFDLVVVTPQYPIEPREGVLRNPLPLHGVTRVRLAAAADESRSRFAHLPRPWITVLVGGSSELFTLDAKTAARLARSASALARASGGSLLVTTSARTPADAADALFASINVPAERCRWSADAPENPYWGYLALADAFVVTGDSVSMLAEACAVGKPVHIFDPGRGSPRGSADFAAAVRRRFQNFGLPRLRRDLRRVHDELVRLGSATLLGDGFTGGPPPRDHVPETAARVRQLLLDLALPDLVSVPRPTCPTPGPGSRRSGVPRDVAHCKHRDGTPV
jgi:mitochondrial fission protein ELM1